MDTAITGLGERDLRAHMTWLRRLAARLVSAADPDDAVQETLLAAVEHRPSLDRDLRPWLARVLANFAHDTRRSDARRRAREAAAVQLDADAVPDAEQLLERHEAARVVAGLVSRLREPHRTLVLLRFAEGIAPVDIARGRGLPEGTVRRQLKEAVDQLRAGVVAHYGDDRRDWRMALAPLAGMSPGRVAGAWKGALWMTTKTKFGLAVAATLLLVLLFAFTRRSSTDIPQAAKVAHGVDGEQNAGDRARTIPTTRPALTATKPPHAPTPPQLAAAAVAADPPDCEKQLARLRAVASARDEVSHQAFEVAKASPSTERRAAPIVERVLGSGSDRPAYLLECRVSICRVGVVTDAEATGVPPAWMHALEADPAFGPVRGENRGARLKSTRTRDALTGRLVAQHWLYFSIPAVAGEEHPLETRADAATCGERLVALQRGLEAERAREALHRDWGSERRRRFDTAPPNAELTRRVTAAFAPLLATDGGTWDCRGTEDCRWHGPAGLKPGIRPRHVAQALAAQGAPGDIAIITEKDTAGPTAGTKIALHFNVARDRGAPAADE